MPAAAGLAVSLAPNPFNPAGGIVKPAVAGGTTGTPPEPAAPETPIDVLKKKLDEMGINSAGLGLSESRTVVSYPGGSFVNHLINVDFGGGVSENYDVGLMLRNPWLTAFEIDRLRKTPA